MVQSKRETGADFEQFCGGRKPECPEETLEVRLRSTETQSTYNIVVEVEGVIDVHYASLTSQGVQHRVFYRDGHPSRYQPRPTGLNFGEQTGTGVFPLVFFFFNLSIGLLLGYFGVNFLLTLPILITLLFHYNRLICGTSLASDVKQHVTQQILQGCECVARFHMISLCMVASH